MSPNNLRVFDKELLENVFKELARILKKRATSKAFSFEIIVVGGASILLNYKFRNTTIDIDCIEQNGAMMNEVINEVGEKFNLHSNWINQDFINTRSFSQKLIEHSTFYKSYGNGILDIRTIKDEYLLAMKLVSGRRYKNDYSDIVGILKENADNGKIINKEDVYKAIITLYGGIDIVDKEALEFFNEIVDHLKITNYKTIVKQETDNKKFLLEKLKAKDSVDKETLLSDLYKIRKK